MSKVAGCILYQRADGLILAVDRFNKSGVPFDYGLPGGKLEPNETPLEAAMREAREETGLIVSILENKSFAQMDAECYMTFVYRALVADETKVRSSAEGETLWVTPEQLLGPQCTFRDFNRYALKVFGLD